MNPLSDLNQPGVYLITNKINGKKYVGQAQNVKRRWRDHRNPKLKQPISSAIRKYGVENFSFDVLEFCDISRLNEVETHYIKSMKCLAPDGYNIAPQGGTCRGVKHSSEVRQKVSTAQKSNWDNPVIRAKRVAASRIANADIGKRTIIGNAVRSCWADPERAAKWRASIQESSRRPKSRARQSVLSKAIHARPEVKAKQLASLRKAFDSDDVKERVQSRTALRYKPLLQYSINGCFIAEHRSITDAAQSIGGDSGGIVNHLSGHRRSAYGYIWRYAQQGQPALFLE